MRRAAEPLLVLVVSLYAAWAFTDLSGATQLAGREMEFLTSSAHTAARHLHENGYIPLWQPYLGEGRPLIESPFAFVLNPFSAGPSLILGDGVRGIKASVVLYALLAAYGGWFCAYAFGMGAAGRVLLALLMLGKGNMAALLGIGHFQLAVAQAYMPWIIGAALLILRMDGRRWVVVLLGLAFALQFLAGNVWHLLPTLLSVVGLAAAYIVWDGVNWRGLARLGLAALITLGLSVTVLLPLAAHSEHVGALETAANGDVYAPAGLLLRQYVTGAPLVEQLSDTLAAGAWETRYNYTVPLWYLVVLLVVPLHQGQGYGVWRVWLIGAVLFAFFTAWGVGGLPPFRWAYEHVPLLERWRFVGRAFGMASFWLALLVALRADGLWRALSHTPRLTNCLRERALGLLLLASVVAGVQVTHQTWRTWVHTIPAAQPSAPCLAWLVAQGDPQPLIVHQEDYRHVRLFIDLGVRHHPLAAAYRPLPVPYTVYNDDLRKLTLPRYAMPAREIELDSAADLGYAPVEASPLHEGGWRCLWARADFTPYAFSVLENDANRAGEVPRPLTGDTVRPLKVLARGNDTVRVQAAGYGGARGVAAVQEVAYPGWRAYIDGERAPLQSVGGYVGARLPLSTDTHTVTFVYRPPLVYAGGAVTILTAVVCVLYLIGRKPNW